MERLRLRFLSITSAETARQFGAEIDERRRWWWLLPRWTSRPEKSQGTELPPPAVPKSIRAGVRSANAGYATRARQLIPRVSRPQPMQPHTSSAGRLLALFGCER